MTDTIRDTDQSIIFMSKLKTASVEAVDPMIEGGVGGPPMGMSEMSGPPAY